MLKKNGRVRCVSQNSKELSQTAHIPLFNLLVDLFKGELSHFTAPRTNFVMNRNLRRSDPEYGIDLAGVNFEDADFSKSNLRKANFQGARLKNINFEDACLEAADFTSAKLINAYLEGTDFYKAKLYNTDFTDAYLGYANLLSADFDNETVLCDADLTGATLIRVKGLSQEQLDCACSSQNEPPDVRSKDLIWNHRECPN